MLFLAILLASGNAFAADGDASASGAEYQNPFSDYVPFEDEYDVDEDERFMYFGRFFAIGLGTGMHTWTGNIGKLYNTALPVLDARLIYFFDFRLAGQMGINSANHAFNATTTGLTEVNIFRVNLDLKYYFDTQNYSASITAANPYLIAGVSQAYRTQVFQDTNFVTKDNSISVSGGLGVEFPLNPRKSALGLEGRYHAFFFKDRYEGTFAPVGIADTTGPMFSFLTNIIFFF